MTPQKQLSVARPYAKAVFAQAIEDNELKAWSILLDQVRLVIETKPMQALLGDPRIDSQIALACLLELCAPQLFEKGKNFLKVVALHRRLLALPAINDLFTHYKRKQANQVSAKVMSVVPLDKTEEQALKHALEARLHQKVMLEYALAPQLLGGLTIQIENFVIDNSLRGKLERLRATLMN
jgi:F-type H+-transporting ATPase subunit delta